jgi:hypothetical protein
VQPSFPAVPHRFQRLPGEDLVAVHGGGG